MYYKLSENGYKELLKSEGNIPFIYDDLRLGKLAPITDYSQVRGTPTIGIGVAIQGEAMRKEFEPFLHRKATDEELRNINQIRINKFEKWMNDRLQGASLSQSMFDALFSLMWNSGPEGKAVNAAINAVKLGDYAAAQQHILNGPTTSKGQKLPALVQRRAREAAMFAQEGLDSFQRALDSMNIKASATTISFIVSAILTSGITFMLVKRLTA